MKKFIQSEVKKLTAEYIRTNDPKVLAENGLYRVPGFLNDLHFHLDST